MHHASLQIFPVCPTAWCSWQKPWQWLNSDTVLCRMVHGLLQDTHNEFFIQQTVKPNQQTAALSTAPSLPQAQSQAPPQSTGDSNATEWHKGFQVSMQALPPHVSVSIAESILFVGKAVRVLQRPTGPLKSHDLLPQSDAISFAQALRQLQQQEVFDQIGFEHTVDVIRTKVRHLGSVVDTELLAYCRSRQTAAAVSQHSPCFASCLLLTFCAYVLLVGYRQISMASASFCSCHEPSLALSSGHKL